MTYPPHGDQPQHHYQSPSEPQSADSLGPPMSPGRLTSAGQGPNASRKVPVILAALGTLLVLATAGILTVVLRQGSGSDAAASAPSAWDIEQQRMHDQIFEWVQSKCDEPHSGTEVADAGSTLLVDTVGEKDATGADPSTVTCILSRLKTPTAVIAHMDSTRALDGQQQDQWEGFRAAWTYHPDHGMDLILRKA